MNDFELKWPSFNKDSMKALRLSKNNIEILDFKQKIPKKNQKFWLCEMSKNLNLTNNLC